ncbi:MAG: citrate (pro-3S)-lyase subunit beta [Clostridia bacterium]|nr:citrate (pro-3S)-lyase subunit beta [Clostridia bacterium]
MKQLRRSMLFVPGNNPGMIRDAHIYGSDSIMFDLEDSVAMAEKDAARFLVYNALTHLRYGKKELVVRINDLSSGLGIEDLEAIVRARPNVIRLPKTETAQDIIDCEAEIERIEREAGIPVGSTGMMAAIESAKGVLNAYDIARSSKRLIGIALGAEDYVTDLKTTRSDGTELFFARNMILNAARAAGIDAIDTVYSDVNNEEGFLKEVELIKKLGFDGKSVINPRQIPPLHKAFMPSEKDLIKARAIMNAIAQANARGSGVASLNGKMIDRPVVIRAERLLELAETADIIPIEEV